MTFPCFLFYFTQSTRHVTDQSNQASLPILYIKLSSAMGLTWILGFIVPFTQAEFLNYLFVILNSLQGMLYLADRSAKPARVILLQYRPSK